MTTLQQHVDDLTMNTPIDHDALAYLFDEPDGSVSKLFQTWSEWRLTVISATGRVEMGIVLGLYCSLEAADHSQKSAPKGTCRPT